MERTELARKLIADNPDIKARLLNAQIRAQIGRGLTWKALLEVRKERAREMFKKEPDLTVAFAHKRFSGTLKREYLKEMSEEWYGEFPFSVLGADRRSYQRATYKTEHYRFVWDPVDIHEASADWFEVVAGYSFLRSRNYIDFQRNYGFVRLSKALVRHYLDDYHMFAVRTSALYRVKVAWEIAITVVAGREFKTRSQAIEGYGRKHGPRTIWFSFTEVRALHQQIGDARQRFGEMLEGGYPVWLVAIKALCYERK